MITVEKVLDAFTRKHVVYVWLGEEEVKS